jgi:translation initiation factor IF-1
VRLITEEEKAAEWAARYNKLRRELRLLEHDYVTTGTRVFQQHTGRVFDTGTEDI